MQQRRIPYYEGQFCDKKNLYIHIGTAVLWVNSPEEHSSHLRRCGSLKSRIVHTNFCVVLCRVNGSAGYVKEFGFTRALSERNGIGISVLTVFVSDISVNVFHVPRPNEINQQDS